MKLFQLTINGPISTDVFIYDEDTQKEVEAKATRAMRSGHEVTWPNGKSQWFEVHPILTDDFGSAKYVWHSDGNRIECTEVLKTRGEDDQTIRTKFVHTTGFFKTRFALMRPGGSGPKLPPGSRRKPNRTGSGLNISLSWTTVGFPTDQRHEG